MKLTKGAVGCLSRRAAHKDPEMSAFGLDGDLHEAGQMVTEGDSHSRRTPATNERRPVLEVVETRPWHHDEAMDVDTKE